jgi:hypothetical protein
LRYISYWEIFMAGGTANKSVALLSTALAKMVQAEQAIQQIMQNGVPASDTRHSRSDPAITAAIAALQALV